MSANDTAASAISDHAFTPRERNGRREWWDLCEECNLSEAAHLRTRQVRDLGPHVTVDGKEFGGWLPAPPSSNPSDHVGHKCALTHAADGRAATARCVDCNVELDVNFSSRLVP